MSYSEEQESAHLAMLADFEAKHGKDGVRGLRTIKGSVFVGVPAGAAARRWDSETQSGEPSRKDAAAAKLALSGCVLHPDKATVEAWIDERPGIARLIAGEAVELAGYLEVAYRGKS